MYFLAWASLPRPRHALALAASTGLCARGNKQATFLGANLIRVEAPVADWLGAKVLVVMEVAGTPKPVTLAIPATYQVLRQPTLLTLLGHQICYKPARWPSSLNHGPSWGGSQAQGAGVSEPHVLLCILISSFTFDHPGFISLQTLVATSAVVFLSRIFTARTVHSPAQTPNPHRIPV